MADDPTRSEIILILGLRWCNSVSRHPGHFIPGPEGKTRIGVRNYIFFNSLKISLIVCFTVFQNLQRSWMETRDLCTVHQGSRNSAQSRPQTRRSNTQLQRSGIPWDFLQWCCCRNEVHQPFRINRSHRGGSRVVPGRVQRLQQFGQQCDGRWSKSLLEWVGHEAVWRGRTNESFKDEVSV